MNLRERWMAPGRRTGWFLAALWAAYLVAVWLGHERHDELLYPVGALLLGLTGFLFGSWAGLVAGLAIIPVSFAIHTLVGGETVAYDLRENWFRWIVGVVLAAGTGMLSENLRAQARLRKSWQTLLANVPDYILLIDEKERIAFANRTPAGLGVVDVLGQPIAGFVPDAKQQESLMDAIRQALAGGSPSIVEVDGPGPDGSVAHYRCRVVASPGPDGKPAALMLNSDITDMQRVHADLKRSEAQFRSLAENFPDYISRVDRDLKRIYVNPAVKTLWKDLGRIDPQGTRVDQVTATPPSAAKELEDLLRASIADGKRRELHQRVELPDGPHSLHGIIVPERGADGRIETALIVARDVTDAEAAQEALRQSEAHYRALADHIPDQVSRFDRDLKRVYANPAAQRLLAELSVAQPVGKNAEDLPVAARHVSSLVENLRASLAEGKTRTIRERVTMPSGEHVFDVAIVPETNQGQVESLLVTSRDVTESEASKEALRRSEERIRDLMDNLDEVFVSNDLVSGKVVNSAAIERVFGHPKARYDADPMLWSTQLHPEDKGRVMARYVELLAGVPTVDETRIIRPDGSLRWIRASMRPVLDSAGKVVRVDGLLRDITAERATESAEREAQRLREAADFKTQFLNSAAHELATPLTPLKLQLASLRTRMELLPGADRQAFDLLERNVNRLGLLVNDLLDAARLQSGHLRLLPKRLALADLAKAAASSFTDQARAAGIALQLDVRDRDLYAQADESRLTQVLFNLLNNALKFTPSGGHVRLVLRRDGPSALLEVQDDGIGLDRSQMQRLFQPFTQVHDALKVRAGGTGLGLYVTSGIMEQHGGKLEVRSDGPGHGSAFTARLPLSVSSPPSPASSAANERGPPRAADGPGARRAGP